MARAAGEYRTASMPSSHAASSSRVAAIRQTPRRLLGTVPVRPGVAVAAVPVNRGGSLVPIFRQIEGCLPGRLKVKGSAD